MPQKYHAQEFTIANGYWRYTTYSPYSGKLYAQDLYGNTANDIWEITPNTSEVKLSNFRCYYPPVFANKHNWAAYLDSLNQLHIYDFDADTEKVVPNILAKRSKAGSEETFGCSFSPNDKYVLILAEPSAYVYSIDYGISQAINYSNLFILGPYNVMYDWGSNDSTLILIDIIDNYSSTLLSYNFISGQTDTVVNISNAHVHPLYRPFACNQRTGKLFYATTAYLSGIFSLHSYDVKSKSDTVLFSATVNNNPYGIQSEIGGLTWSPDWKCLSFFSYGLDYYTNMHVFNCESNTLYSGFKYAKPEVMVYPLWLNTDTLIYSKSSSVCGYSLSSILHVGQPYLENAGLDLEINNYPNPFNPVTKIKYQLPYSGFVNMTVYNALGQRIETLVEAYKSAGIYTCIFDGSRASSGVYFYQLIVNNVILTKKMLLVK